MYKAAAGDDINGRENEGGGELLIDSSEYFESISASENSSVVSTSWQFNDCREYYCIEGRDASRVSMLKNDEETLYDWPQTMQMMYILLLILVTVLLLIGVVFIARNSSLCDGRSQYWIFSIVVEIFPILYAVLLENALPVWNPALFERRMMVMMINLIR